MYAINLEETAHDITHHQVIVHSLFSEINLNPLVRKKVFEQTCHIDLVVFLWSGVTVRLTFFTRFIKLFQTLTHLRPEYFIFILINHHLCRRMCDVKSSDCLIPGRLRIEHLPTIPDVQPVPIPQLTDPQVWIEL